MRAFQLSAVLVASFGVSAELQFVRGSLSIAGNCTHDCGDIFLDYSNLHECLKSVVRRGVDACDTATLDLRYMLTDIAECPTAAPITGSRSMPLPLTDILKHISTNVGTVRDLAVKHAILGYRFNSTTDCITPKPYIVTIGDICSGERINAPLNVSRETADTELAPTSSSTKAIVNDATGLRVTWLNAPGKACDFKPMTGAGQFVSLSGNISVTPYSKTFWGQVVFNEGCTVAGCDSFTSPSQAESCLHKARQDFRCSTATYSRTFTHVEAAECSSSYPRRLGIKLSDVLVDESALLSSAEKTVITNVYFPRKAAAACKKASVYLVDSCDAASGTHLVMTQIEGTLWFRGDQELSASAQEGMILVGFEEANDSCTLSNDENGDRLSLESHYVISHPTALEKLAESLW